MTDNPFATATEKNVKKPIIQKNFSDEEIKRLFEPSMYLSSNIFFNGNQPNRHANYLLPLIMLFTGARVNEIAQLHISDVYKVRDKKSSKEDTDVWIFDFNSDECDCCPTEHRKSIKNQSSHRKIPVHPSLIEIGLIRYRNIVKERRNEIISNEQLPYQRWLVWCLFTLVEYYLSTKSWIEEYCWTKDRHTHF